MHIAAPARTLRVAPSSCVYSGRPCARTKMHKTLCLQLMGSLRRCACQTSVKQRQVHFSAPSARPAAAQTTPCGSTHHLPLAGHSCASQYSSACSTCCTCWYAPTQHLSSTLPRFPSCNGGLQRPQLPAQPRCSRCTPKDCALCIRWNALKSWQHAHTC